MKLKEMIERVQQHHPNMNITEIVRSLNDAQNDMGFKTEMVESADKLQKHIMRIKSVDYNGKSIKKLLGRPVERDLI